MNTNWVNFLNPTWFFFQVMIFKHARYSFSRNNNHFLVLITISHFVPPFIPLKVQILSKILCVGGSVYFYFPSKILFVILLLEKYLYCCLYVYNAFHFRIIFLWENLTSRYSFLWMKIGRITSLCLLYCNIIFFTWMS